MSYIYLCVCVYAKYLNIIKLSYLNLNVNKNKIEFKNLIKFIFKYVNILFKLYS